MSGAARPADHLVHGIGMALEAPTWPAITEDEARAVLSHFPGTGRFGGLHWHSPRPFSAATLVRAGEGEFFLKRHHRLLRTPEGLAEEHGFMAHLRAGGLAVPEVVTAQDETGAVALGEWSYELHRRALGVDLYRERQSWTPFLSLEHAHAAGAALAHLHRAAAGYRAPAREGRALLASFTILPSRDPLAAADAYVGSRPALAAFLFDRPWRQTLNHLFARLGDGLPALLDRQASLWTHNDWHPSNLLWSANGDVATIFDFGLATRTSALHDIATAIERTAIPWLETDRRADAASALALLEGYRTVLPLSRDDVAALVRLLPLVHVEFALSEIDYFAGIVRDRGQADAAWQDYLVGHAEWFASPLGQAFLRDLAS